MKKSKPGKKKYKMHSLTRKKGVPGNTMLEAWIVLKEIRRGLIRNEIKRVVSY